MLMTTRRQGGTTQSAKMSRRRKDTPILNLKKLCPARRRCKVDFLIVLKSSIRYLIRKRIDFRSKYKEIFYAVVCRVTTFVTVKLEFIHSWEKAVRVKFA